MSFLAVATLVGLAWLIGHGLRGWLAGAQEIRPYRALLQLAVGSLALYLGEWLLHALGLGWSRLSLLAWMALCVLVARVLGQGQSAPAALPVRWGWGDAVALAALAAFAFCALKLWILNPDFVYHWGIKGAKLYLAGGIDEAFLTQPWDAPRHPDYPLLYPGQLAATALVAGAFSEPALMLWTVLLFAGLLAAARQVLVQLEVQTSAAQAAMALLGLVLGAFGVGYLMAGSPDWFLALAPLAAWPLLAKSSLTPRRHGVASALALGTLAALVAGAKMEGLPLAAILVVAYTLRQRELTPKSEWLRSALLASLPTVAVALPWMIFNYRHGLSSSSDRGSFLDAPIGVIVEALLESIRVVEWHGFAWLLLALPLLVWLKPTRAVASICLAQLGFYLFVYLSLPYSEPEPVSFFVRSNFPRLAFHLMPTTLVACAVALARLDGRLGRREISQGGGKAGAGPPR